MKKTTLGVLLLLFFSTTQLLAASKVYHKHGDRGHSHVLPNQGLNHQHGGAKKSQPVQQKNIIQPAKRVSSAKPEKQNAHIHGHIFHEHPLPKEGYEHKHGSSVIGRKLVSLEDFPYTGDDTPFFNENRAYGCLLTAMMVKKSLSVKFNPYTDWGGLCNRIKTAKPFKDKAYEMFGKGGSFEYPNFEKDFTRLLNMNVDDYKKVKVRSTKDYTSTSGGSRCHSVGGYYRKSGTYVRGHTRCR